VPLSTSDGVKAIDVAWLSDKRSVEAEATPCLTRAPEICVEILSPSNTTSEIQEKIALYLEAGLKRCGYADGLITFYRAEGKMGTSV
jgi:Uma2 family endonuclease